MLGIGLLLGGEKVVAKIKIWPENNKNPEGEITEIRGNRGDIGLDVLCILKRYGINNEFSENVIYYN